MLQHRMNKLLNLLFLQAKNDMFAHSSHDESEHESDFEEISELTSAVYANFYALSETEQKKRQTQGDQYMIKQTKLKSLPANVIIKLTTIGVYTGIFRDIEDVNVSVILQRVAGTVVRDAILNSKRGYVNVQHDLTMANKWKADALAALKNGTKKIDGAPPDMVLNEENIEYWHTILSEFGKEIGLKLYSQESNAQILNSTFLLSMPIIAQCTEFIYARGGNDLQNNILADDSNGYGEISQYSVHELITDSRLAQFLQQKSKVLDIGSGYANWLVQLKLENQKVSLVAGIEYEARQKVAKKNMNDLITTLVSSDVKYQLESIKLYSGNAHDFLKNHSEFTFLYMFDFIFTHDSLVIFAEILKKYDFEVLVTFRPINEWKELGLNLELVFSMKQHLHAKSGSETCDAYVCKRIVQ